MAIDGIAKTVDDAPKPGGGRVDLGALGRDADLRPRRHAFDRPERHHQGPVLAEADDLDGQGGIVAANDLATRADLHVAEAALGLDQQAVDHGDTAIDAQALDGTGKLDKVFHGTEFKRFVVNKG